MDLGGAGTGAQLYSITERNSLSPKEMLPLTVTTSVLLANIFSLLGQRLRRDPQNGAIWANGKAGVHVGGCCNLSLLESCGPAECHGSSVSSVTEWIFSADLPAITEQPESIKGRKGSSNAPYL